MPDDWDVVQVGPVLQVPRQARFRGKQGWWYIYQRSRLVLPPHTERETDPWSSPKFRGKTQAEAAMYLHARSLRLPWQAVRGWGRLGEKVVSYHINQPSGEYCKPFDTDTILTTGWGVV